MHRTTALIRNLGKLITLQSSRTTRCLSHESDGSIDFGGMSPPIPTPFDKENGKVAYDMLAQNFEKWNQISFRGYVVQGSNGEYPYLTSDERVELVKNTRQMIPPEKLLIAGSGCESTAATIDMTQKMADNGADAALVITPFYYKSGMTSSAIASHYEQVADESPIPIIVYNVPVNTGLDLSVGTIARLSNHRNIVGMKDSSGDISKLALVVHKTRSAPGGFQVLAGSASFLLPAYAIGCVGGVCALANILGDQVCMLQDLFKAGKMEEAKILQHRLVAPNLAVTKEFGVPGLKMVLDQFGFYGGPVRSPLQPLSSEDTTTVMSVFRSNGFYKS